MAPAVREGKRPAASARRSATPLAVWEEGILTKPSWQSAAVRSDNTCGDASVPHRTMPGGGNSGMGPADTAPANVAQYHTPRDRITVMGPRHHEVLAEPERGHLYVT
jgi:hypothetical protein